MKECKILVCDCYKEVYLDYFKEWITHAWREFNCDSLNYGLHKILISFCMNCQATILTFCQSAILEQCVLGKFATFILKYNITKL